MVIEAPDNQSTTQRTVGVLLRTLFWALYLYLLLPLATLFVWLGGVLVLNSNLLLPDYWEQFVAWLPQYALTVVVLSGTLILWSLIQWRRFRGRERRQHVPPLDLDALAQALSAPIDDVVRVQAARRLVAHHHSDGRVSHFETNSGDQARDTSASAPTSAASH